MTAHRRTAAGFGATVAFEWTKFRTLRSTVGVVVALAVALPLMSAVVALTGSLAPDDTVLGASVLGGAALAQLLAVVSGALLVTSETRSGTICSTLLAQPDRLTLLLAKCTVAAAVVLAVTLPSAAAAHGLGLLLLDTRVHPPGEPFPALVGVALAVATIAVLGVALGTVLRHSAAAVAAGVAVVLGPGLLAPLFGDLQRWVGGASLTGVLQKLTQSSDAVPEAVGTLGAWPSLLVAVTCVCATAVVAALVTGRRDM